MSRPRAIPQVKGPVAEASRPDLLAEIRHDTPAAWRDLAALHPHPSPSRPLDPGHVVDLARSIAALGLIHPLVVDVEDVVVAGSHRYAALRLLQTSPEERLGLLKTLCPGATSAALSSLAPATKLLQLAPDAVDYQRIPVRILPLSQRTQPEDAWRVEVAENERRRDYAPKEVKALAERLKAQGYRFASGKAKEGEQAALPVLATLIGKSERTIRRMLSGEDESRTNGRDVFQSDVKSAITVLQRLKARHAERFEADQHRVLDKALKMIGNFQ